MQLTPARRGAALLAGLLALGLGYGHAHADGEVAVRAAYYKERSTRVTQPMVDGAFDVGDNGRLQAHMLLDAITSASAAAGGDGAEFTEKRYQSGVNYLHQVGRFAVGGLIRYSNEPDYKSYFGGVRGQVELAQRNTTLGVSLTGGRDEITNAGAGGGLGTPIEGDLTTTLVGAQVSQLLSPRVVAGLSYDFGFLKGFQENPYRTVSAGGVVESERVPTIRKRHAIAGSLRAFVPATKSTVITTYRFYRDSWGILGHTPEVRLVQDLSGDVDVHFRLRYHRQSAADFYKEIYDTNDRTMEPYLTDDVKLSAYTTQTYGAKVTSPMSKLGFTGNLGDARADLLVEYIVQNNRFGNALVTQFVVKVPFAY